MSSIVPAAQLTRAELRQLGRNVIHAVDHDGDEPEAVECHLVARSKPVNVSSSISAAHRPAPGASPRPAA